MFRRVYFLAPMTYVAALLGACSDNATAFDFGAKAGAAGKESCTGDDCGNATVQNAGQGGTGGQPSNAQAGTAGSQKPDDTGGTGATGGTGVGTGGTRATGGSPETSVGGSAAAETGGTSATGGSPDVPGGASGAAGETSSIPSLCQLPLEAGDCEDPEVLYRFGFDSVTGRCERFVYHGCLGNENRFDELEDCIATCDPNALECDEAADCALQMPGCCAACEPYVKENFVAVPAPYADVSLCSGEQPMCGMCAEYAGPSTLANFEATCVEHRCEVIEYETPPGARCNDAAARAEFAECPESPDEATCLARGGSWEVPTCAECTPDQASCHCELPDAGCPCEDESECAGGGCYNFETDDLSSLDGEPCSGVCSHWPGGSTLMVTEGICHIVVE